MFATPKTQNPKWFYSFCVGYMAARFLVLIITNSPCSLSSYNDSGLNGRTKK